MLRRTIPRHSAVFVSIVIGSVLVISPLASFGRPPPPTTWNGQTDTDWGTTTNWSSVPTGTSSVVISTAANQPVVSDSNSFNVASILIYDPITSLTFNRSIDTPYSGGLRGQGQVILNGTGTVTLSGTTLDYSGATVINAGKLAVLGSLTSSPITVNSGGGLYFGTGSILSATVSGLVDAGLQTATATGSLSLLNGATMTLSLGGAGSYGKYTIGGQLTPAGTLSIELANLFTPQLGDSFDILDFGSLGSGTFTSFDLPTLGTGLDWDTSALYTTGSIRIAASAIPEPSTYAALAGAAVLGVAAWRRRTKRTP